MGRRIRLGGLGIPVLSCLLLSMAGGCAKHAAPAAREAAGAPASTPVAAAVKDDARRTEPVDAPPPAPTATVSDPVTVASVGPAAAAPAATIAPSKASMAAPKRAAGARALDLDAKEEWSGGGGFAVAPQFAGVKAGEWDDNANFREFQRFLASSPTNHRRMNLGDRRFVVVRDSKGHGVPRCSVTIRDDRQASATFLTTASGRSILFPHAEGLSGDKLTAVANCAEGTAETSVAISDTPDGIVDLRLPTERATIGTRVVDLAFVLDTTGSMSEEISAVKSTIQKVAKVLSDDQTTVRIGLVEYKDRTDPFVTKVYPFATDLGGFAQRVSQIGASGGGDTPEDMNAGLHTAMSGLDWSDKSVARLAFVIADAPPHLDYQDGPDYAADMKTASHRGIQLFTVAASGMDNLGQVVFRQMAQFTGGTNMFVLRGGAGPQSTGGGDPMSSCGGTHTNYSSGKLDELIVQKIRRELKALDGDPMRIAGLRTDENAKPCDQRVVFAD
jgi:hypothetical protein